jgi:hypothetical protein
MHGQAGRLVDHHEAVASVQDWHHGHVDSGADRAKNGLLF